MSKTQLLCTFSSTEDLEDTVERILDAYDLAFGKIYVLENLDEEHQLVLTYNVFSESNKMSASPSSTISVHRKKKTNTIYTINGINKLIEQKIGHIDKSYRIDWEELQNTVLVTAYDNLKKINTKLINILEID